jgi:hypothetical protein
MIGNCWEQSLTVRFGKARFAQNEPLLSGRHLSIGKTGELRKKRYLPVCPPSTRMVLPGSLKSKQVLAKSNQHRVSTHFGVHTTSQPFHSPSPATPVLFKPRPNALRLIRTRPSMKTVPGVVFGACIQRRNYHGMIVPEQERFFCRCGLEVACDRRHGWRKRLSDMNDV